MVSLKNLLFSLKLYYLSLELLSKKINYFHVPHKKLVFLLIYFKNYLLNYIISLLFTPIKVILECNHVYYLLEKLLRRPIF